MAKRFSGPVHASCLGVLGVVLATAVPATHALQPEPQMMFETDAGAAATSVAAIGGPLGKHGSADGKRGGPQDMRGGPPPLLPPFIQLSGEQQDKLFELRHAQEPALRAQMKELRGAHAQLQELAMADIYDEARVRQIVSRAAQASGELALMHGRLQHAVFLLLTPEQRKRLEQCRPGSEGAPPPDCQGPPR